MVSTSAVKWAETADTNSKMLQFIWKRGIPVEDTGDLSCPWSGRSWWFHDVIWIQVAEDMVNSHASSAFFCFSGFQVCKQKLKVIQTILMRILPANSEGRWIFIFVIWLCICLSFLFCAVIFLSFSHPARVAGPGADLESRKTSFCQHMSHFFAFFVHCFWMFFALFGISQMGRHLFGIIFAFPNQSDKKWQ
jgi:hypothetical protein